MISAGRCNQGKRSTSSSSSRISRVDMEGVLERLKANQHRNSTKQNYLNIWRNFNSFLVHLDSRPKHWEDRATLYCAYLVDRGRKSATIRSYMSAIKNVLITDNYEWDDDKVMVNIISRACRISNDVVKTRFPIHIGLLETLLFELKRLYSCTQPYLYLLFKAMFLVAYYGLMWIGELAMGDHTLKANDVYVGENKNKLMLVLHSSKTRGKESDPQCIKISQVDTSEKIKRHFCPFAAVNDFGGVRMQCQSDDEPFFVFTDGSPVKPVVVRNLLKRLLKRLNINPKLYNCQSFRIGRATDLAKFGISIEVIKHLGRWKSNAVYKYLKHWY